MSVMEGSLSKWTNVVKGWQYRWFVLDENAGLLSYYTSKEKMMRGVRRGCVRLKGAVIGIDDEDDSTFTITVDHKTFHFQARDAEEREKWIRALEDTILRHVSRMRWETSKSKPSILDFDNKVAEADAYLQIMIDQTKALEERIGSITDLEEQEKYKMVRDQSNTMLDHIKHSIVLLQIAKNTAYPVNGIYMSSTNNKIDSGETTTVVDSTMPSTVIFPGYSTNSSGQMCEIQTGIELATDCMNPRRQSNVLAVPETSYSSSEGEDDFYDANDSPFASSIVSSPSGVRSFSNEDPSATTPGSDKNFDSIESNNLVKKAIGNKTVAPSAQISTNSNTGNNIASIEALPTSSSPAKSSANVTNSRQFSLSSRSTSLPFKNDGSLDYDALYEEEIEEDDTLLESHGSIISHLISQIKIGMDLTKVVLPTFILERRSLLEMYADYFAHPDLFLSITDLPDPRDRMVQVVKWYLSSYHAGRKSSVAKKPYNPILGEVFRCHWDFSNTKSNSHSTNQDKVLDGPVPWCTTDQLTFASEQVSHHPPISAFYAEHYNKRISFCAHVYTKSKFLGLSVCVYNIGEGRVNLLDWNEEYVLTFPNGYGRSILTVPWIELGGSVKISCEKSGYHTDIEFITKPFYSNKKHRVTADIFAPNEKNPFVKISGEWNGIMEAKWTADGKTETFIDVNSMEIVKKIVKPIDEQEENESRRLWKEVTAGLRFNDIDKATQAKYELEQKQRDEAKQRASTNTLWETKLFQPVGDRWVFINSLEERLKQKKKVSS